jgi:ketosteroid isomerase-like protein
MAAEATRATADALVAYCRAGTTEKGLQELYDPGAISVEAAPMPDGSRESHGVEAIRAKHAWWNRTMEVHEERVEGPYMHGPDRFAVIFGYDASSRETGDRMQMQEVAVYTCDDAGRIVREEFFYTS